MDWASRITGTLGVAASVMGVVAVALGPEAWPAVIEWEMVGWVLGSISTATDCSAANIRSHGTGTSVTCVVGIASVVTGTAGFAAGFRGLEGAAELAGKTSFMADLMNSTVSWSSLFGG